MQILCNKLGRTPFEMKIQVKMFSGCASHLAGHMIGTAFFTVPQFGTCREWSNGVITSLISAYESNEINLFRHKSKMSTLNYEKLCRIPISFSVLVHPNYTTCH